jgi:hypothetical protein
LKSFLIKDWSRGFANFPDLKDLGIEYSNTINNYNARPGSLVKRDRATTVNCSAWADASDSITAPLSVAEFNLASVGNNVRFLLVHQSDTTPLSRHVWRSAATYASNDSIGNDNWGGTTSNHKPAKFTVINNTIRATFGSYSFQKLVAWYGKIERERFNSEPGASLDGWYLENAYIETGMGSGLAGAVAATNYGGGTALNGKYFFRYTSEYDNFQEGWWSAYGGSDTDSVSASTGQDLDAIDLTITATRSAVKSRLTGINVYVAFSSSLSGNNPETAFYFGGRIDINTGLETSFGYENDRDWASTAADTSVITARIFRTSSATFPAGHNLDGQNFEEELYTRTNAVVQPDNENDFQVYTYSDMLWMNQRLFVINPKFARSEDKYPYETEQVLLFSQLGQPDVFHVYDDFVDLSTAEGDQCMRIFSLWGDVIVLKKYNMFRIRFNNSGNSLDWSIQEHYQDIGCVAENSLAVGNGRAFWCGEKHIYMFDGNRVVPITKDTIEETYRGYLSNSYTAFSDYDEIYGVYDVKSDRYIVQFVETEDCYCLVYDVQKGAWLYWRFDNYVDGDNLPGYITTGVDKDLFVVKAEYGTGQDVGIFKIEDSGTDETGVTSQYKSNWLDLNGNPQQQKRLIEAKLRFKNNGTNTVFKIYKDSSGVATFTSASLDSSGAEVIKYARDSSGNNPSMVGKQFMVEVVESTASTFATSLEVYEIELQYERLGNR